jgi:hypothetical protein
MDQAMARLGRGRATIGSIAPQPSQDLSAISGWIHHPSFKPVVAHPIRLPRPPVVTPPKATEPPAAEPAAAAAEPKTDPAAKNVAKPAKPVVTPQPAQAH